MNYIDKEKLIEADIASIENRVRHAFNQGYDLGYKKGKANCLEIPKGSTIKNDLLKYCERSICLRNEYNNIGCEACEVTKSQELTTQERQAESDKFDAAFQDGYNNGYAQARFDYEQEPTTKNNLEVDCISRQATINAVKRIHPVDTDYDCTLYDKVDVMYVLDEMPSVTPQNQVYPLCEDCHTKMDEVRRAYDNAMKQEPRKGHWIKEESIYGWDGHSYQCSVCGRSIHLDAVMEVLADYPYCHCGARMIEPQESENT